MQLPPSDPNKDPLKPWWQAAHFTINTNSTDLRLVPRLRQIWQYLIAHFAEFVVGRPDSQLLDVKSGPYNVEIGPRFHRVHSHGTIAWYTTGIGWIDLEKLRLFVNKNLQVISGFKRANTHMDLIKNYNSIRTLEEYINKNPFIEPMIEEFEILPP